MSIDITAKTIEPVRQTYDQVARRIGEGKAASRYQEAVYDVQPTTNFHYRPTWDKDHELYDKGRTRIVMEDWYSFMDPRQYYYGNYTVARARQQDSMENNFAFIEKKELLASVPGDVLDSLRECLIPFRHVEWGANMNNCYITDFGYGTSITTATTFNAMDRLGIAQYLTRIALLIDGNEEKTLTAARKDWLEDEAWQPLRHAMEDIFVLDDWFETFVAQDIVMDGLVYPLMFDRYMSAITSQGGASLVMLTEFMSDWFAESVRWTDRLMKVTASESEENSALLAEWTEQWSLRISDALKPIAEKSLGDSSHVTEILNELCARMNKQGVKLEVSL